VDLYSASSRSASIVLLLPVSRHWSRANPTGRHQRTLRDHVRDHVLRSRICLFTLPAFASYSFQP